MNESSIPEILYYDNDLLIVNKSAGLLSIQDGYHPDLPHLKTVLQPEFGTLWIVHRLDKDTSGVMVIARHAEAHRKLNEAFRERHVEKVYHGLVTPTPNWHQKEVSFPLQINADRKHRTWVDSSNGKTALTAFSVEKWFTLGALIKISIKTGITHQIRAHLRALDLSLLGDKLYHAGLPEQPIIAERTMLHARSIAFSHPINQTWQQFSANYPDDFRAAYTELRLTTGRDAMI